MIRMPRFIMILGTQEEVVTRMKCVLLIRNNVLIIHRVKYQSLAW